MRLFVTFLLFSVWSAAADIPVFAETKQTLVDQTLNQIENSRGPNPAEAAISDAKLKVQAAEGVPAAEKVSSGASAEGVTPAKTVIDVLDFRNTDVLEAVDEIGRKSGLLITVTGEIRGSVTLYVQNIDVWDALKIVLEPNRLAYAQENGQVLVMKADEFRNRYGYNFNDKIQTRIIKIFYIDQEILVSRLITLKSPEGKIIVDGKSRQLILMDSVEKLAAMGELVQQVDVALETKKFALQFAQVKDVKEKVAKMLTELVGRAEYDVERRTVTVTDTKEKLEAIGALIRQNDQQIDVSVEAQVLQIRLLQEHEQGVDWEAIVSDYQKLELSGVNLAGKADLKLGTITEEDYSVLLDALGTVGEVKKLSKTETTALVNFFTEMKLESHDEKAQGPSAGQRDKNGFEMLLKVKPDIEAGQLVMNVIPKLYLILDNRLTTGHWRMEIYEKAEPVAVGVGAHELIVIGGLIRETEVNREAKFPLLGDLPIFGFAFRRQDKLIEKTEYVVFLKPKVITGAAPAAAPAP